VPKWWKLDSKKSGKDDEWRNPTDFKKNSSKTTEIDESAKKMHLVTDVKKAIFKALMSSDDYLHAYEQLMHLNLKKT
jgi:nucleolar MIF4G domain-containing protein 1